MKSPKTLLFAMNYQGRRVDFNDLIRYFECNPMKLLAYNEDFEALVNEGILSRERSRRRRNVMNGNEEFRVSEAITEAILKNKPMPVMADTTCNDIVDLLEHVVQLVDDREEPNPTLCCSS